MKTSMKITGRALSLAFISAILAVSCTDNSTRHAVEYPITKKGDVKEMYYDVEVKDPYRWLENLDSQETVSWVNSQKELTQGYLEKIPYRDSIRKVVRQSFNYERMEIPSTVGDMVYVNRNSGLEDHDILYRYEKNLDIDQSNIFLDPNIMSKDGTTSIEATAFSKNKEYFAYAISEGGSDWRKIITMNVADGTSTGDTINAGRFTGVSWKDNDGFFYSAYIKPEKWITEYTDHHYFYYHKLGTKQSDDELIFGGAEGEKYRYVSGRPSSDGRFIVISASNYTSGNKIFIKSISGDASKTYEIPNNEGENSYRYLFNEGNKFYFLTNHKAPNNKVVVFDLSGNSINSSQELIAETEDPLISISKIGDKYYVKYLVDGFHRIKRYSLDGKKEGKVELPENGTINGFGGKDKEGNIYYTYTDYLTPKTIYKYNEETGKSEVFFKPTTIINKDNYKSDQVFYESKDGTKIPMVITYNKNINKNDKNPTFLYAYGGYGDNLIPRYRPELAAWLELGGVLAIPNLRGGGEYGEKWHKDGARFNKQNVFDDFVYAAKYLFEEGFTSPDYLAINGESNGGLLIGNMIAFHPDIARVALPDVGLLDMLRYDKFTSGKGWTSEFGNSEESEEMFKYLFDYSPVYNVKKGGNYPATLVTTGDHDDRVPPLHSYKFVAELQSGQKGPHPILLRVLHNAGHGWENYGRPTSMTIQKYTDTFSFSLYNMGFEVLPIKK